MPVIKGIPSNANKESPYYDADTIEIECYNGGASAIPANVVVKFDTTTDSQHGRAITVAGLNEGPIVGVTKETIPPKGTGKVIIYGPATVTAAGTITAGDILKAAANGAVVKMSTSGSTPAYGRFILGYAISSISNGATGRIFVQPGVATEIA